VGCSSAAHPSFWQSEGPEPSRLESSDPKREADEPSTWAYALCKCHIECCARPHRDRHGRTTEAFTLLMSIRIPLENTNWPEPHTLGGVGAPTPSLREAGLPSTKEVAVLGIVHAPPG
jgi:hypothetical protein